MYLPTNSVSSGTAVNNPYGYSNTTTTTTTATNY